ncbi:MAG: RluA family pseudouridine synthase, partial [Oscillospiraceae bacterium]
MKCYQIKANDAGQRLDRFVQKVAPRLPVSMLQRSIRIKRIKVNGHRAQNNQMLTIGDVVELYLNDEFFMPDEASPLGFLAAGQELDILYEDENLMLVNKHPGLVVHEDDAGERDTLIARILRHLYEAGQYNPCDENSFSPALCNRIDRNTSGIVIAAKNAQTLRVVNALLRERLIHKYYLCLTHGNLTPPDGLLKGYLVKDAEANRVQVLDAPAPGAKTALTSYHTLQ